MSIASGLVGSLPPKLRRTAAGAWLDLKSLPERLLDPSRWDEPFQMLHNVGGGDFDRVGRTLLAQLQTYASLTPGSDVLDVGCGTGRLARPLAAYLEPSSTYVGLDVSLAAVVACRRRIGRKHANFRFVRADIRNHEYNPLGALDAESYVFPAADGSVDLVFAFSVFSHMTELTIARYLGEARRVLRPGGVFAFTAYALTPERLAALERGEGRFAFRPWYDGAMVVDRRSPERAIAHPLDRLNAAITSAGLTAGEPLAGGRIGAPAYDGLQDLFIARRPG